MKARKIIGWIIIVILTLLMIICETARLYYIGGIPWVIVGWVVLIVVTGLLFIGLSLIGVFKNETK